MPETHKDDRQKQLGKAVGKATLSPNENGGEKSRSRQDLARCGALSLSDFSFSMSALPSIVVLVTLENSTYDRPALSIFLFE